MFNFSMREEEENPVSGTYWENPCMSPCPDGDIFFSSGRRQRPTTKRIDMAAVVNDSMAIETMLPKEGDLEGTTAGEWSSSDDLRTQGSEDEKVAGCGPIFCTPCMWKIWMVGALLLVFFLTGLSIALGVRDRSTGGNSVSSLESDPARPIGGSNITPLPPDEDTEGDAWTMMPTQAPVIRPTAVPSVFAIEIEFEQDDIDGQSNTDDDFVALELDPTWADPGSQSDLIETDNESTVIDTGSEENTAESSGESSEQFDNLGSPFLVGVYYYPWHGSNFHNGDGYIRRDLIPPQQPTLGEYDDSKPETIAQHLRWSRQANIGLWITSWWGPNRLEDSNTKDVIMQHSDLGNLKIALHYETSNRVRGGLTGVSGDMDYLCEHYFGHSNYYKINGRPVIFVYVTRRLDREGTLESTILTMRTSASKCGHDIFLVGDHVFDEAPSESEIFVPFWYFDAVTNYDVYGSMGRPSPYAGRSGVDKYYSDQSNWRARALASGCNYIPAVSPGYNDRGVRFERNHPPLSRKLDANSPEGSLFAYQLSQAKTLVDPSVDNLLVVNSFNEWHEDTQIEPTVGGRTNDPFNLTQGIYYEGYGELYLNLLRQYTLD